MTEEVRALLTAHAALRRDLAALSQAVSPLAAGPETQGRAGAVIADLALRQSAWPVHAFCHRYGLILNTHHDIEDARLFPDLETVDPGLAPTLRELAEDHVRLSRLLDEVDEAIAALSSDSEQRELAERLLETLAAQLDAHLEREERAIIPILARTGTSHTASGLGGLDAHGAAGGLPS